MMKTNETGHRGENMKMVRHVGDGWSWLSVMLLAKSDALYQMTWLRSVPPAALLPLNGKCHRPIEDGERWFEICYTVWMLSQAQLYKSQLMNMLELYMKCRTAASLSSTSNHLRRLFLKVMCQYAISNEKAHPHSFFRDHTSSAFCPWPRLAWDVFTTTVVMLSCGRSSRGNIRCKAADCNECLKLPSC